MAFFVSDCLTVPVGGTYIGFTEGGSLIGVAGFVDFSAKGGRGLGRFIGPGGLSAVLGGSQFGGSLTLLMEEREAQAAGPCGSGGLASLDVQAVRTKERWLCFKRATRFGWTWVFGPGLDWRAR